VSEPVRLARRLAQQAGCSRSEAQQYIEGGWVTVDGVTCEEPGVRVAPEQTVDLTPGAKAEPALPVTILFHKPPGLATGPAGSPDSALILPSLVPERRSATDHSGVRPLKKHLTGLILTDGLETAASGLLVLTQDWRIARRLVDDASRIEQEFIVETAMPVTPWQLALLNQGTRFNGKQVEDIKASCQSESRLRFALKTPARGLLDHLCAQAGLQVLGMRRIRIGRVPLAGLPVGQWCYLPPYQKF
jgi:23S rRNA pseudouridine2604 synthase